MLKGGRLARLQTQVLFGVLVVSILSVVTSGLFVRNRMLAAFLKQDADRLGDRADIYDRISNAPLFSGDLESIKGDVEAAAKDARERVVLTDNERNVIADSDIGSPIPKRVDFATFVPQTRRTDAQRPSSASCFAAANLSQLSELPPSYNTFQEVVAVIDNPDSATNEFERLVSATSDDEAGELKRCLSREFAFDGPVGLVFIGTGRQEQFQFGPIAPWLGLAASLLGAATLLAWLVARQVTKPLRALTSATTMVASGRFAEPLAPQRGEVGELATAFNAMTRRLNDAEYQRTQLVRDLSHELRNPLGVLQAQIEAAADGIIPLTDETLDIMHQEVRQLTELVNDLHLLASFDSHSITVNTQPVELSDIVRGVMDNYRIAFPDYRFETELDEVSIDGDPVRLRQVVSNIVRNAVQHTPAAGQITATVKRRGNVVNLSITDTGVGIAAADVGHMFDRFWRADASRQRVQHDNDGDRGMRSGAGLGLSICKSIVEAHHGTITAESVVGQGTTIMISLPVAG